MRKTIPLLAAVFLIAGCSQKLNYEKTIELEPVNSYKISFSAPAYQQAVKVTVEPADCSVSAYVVKESDVEELEKALNLNKAGEAKYVLAGKTYRPKDSKQDILLEATIPAKTPYALVLYGGSKTTKVKVKAVGK